MLGQICTCFRVNGNPMFMYILNLLRVPSKQADIIIAKCRIKERNNVTRLRFDPDYVMRVAKATPLFSRPCSVDESYRRFILFDKPG